jgi:hypothetical protein
LIAGLIFCSTGVEVAAQTNDFLEKLGAMMPGLLLIALALRMNYRKAPAKCANHDDRDKAQGA